MIYLRGCWEYLSTLLICFLTPFVRKCFYGLCAFQLIVNIFMSGPSNAAVNKVDGIMTTSVIEARSNEASTDILIATTSPVLTNITEMEQSSGRAHLKTIPINCSTNASSDVYLNVMEGHTQFYLYILLSSIVPTILLTLVSLFATTNFKYALKAIFKFPLILFEPLVMPFVFQGVDNNPITGVIKLQTSDVLHWKSGSKTISLSMWATDVNFLNIILDGVFGCMFAALTTEFEQLCIDQMLEKNEYFNILMWAGLGLKLLLHLLVLLIKFGCPENILTPSYTSLGSLDLEADMNVIDNHSCGTSGDVDFDEFPNRCRLCFGRFVAFIGITFGVVGVLGIFTAFFTFVYGGFGIPGINNIELSDLDKIVEDYGLLLSIPLLALFIPVSVVVWCCLRAHSKSYHSSVNTNIMPCGCFSCCLLPSTAAFFLFLGAIGMIILPAGMVFAVVIAGQKEIKFRDYVKAPGYLIGLSMGAFVMILSSMCGIPSSFYFLWNRGFRQGNARYKDEFYEDCDRSTFKDQVEDVKSQSKTRSHANVPPAFRPTGATNVGRFDSFRETIPPNSTDMEMSLNTTAPGIVEEKPQTNIPTPAKRSPKLDPPNGDLNRDHNRNKKEASPKANEKRYSIETNPMDTVYENESLEAMIPPMNQQISITPNAPPLTDSARESLERGGQIVI